MGTSLQFFAQGLPALSNQINQRLEDAILELNSQENQHPIIQEFNSIGIQQVVVGPSHFCFLLDDGTVHRLSYSVEVDRSINPEPIDASNSNKNKNIQEPPTKKVQIVEDLGNVGRPIPPPPPMHSSSVQAQVERIDAASRRAASGPPSRAMMDRHRTPHRRMMATLNQTRPPTSSTTPSGRGRSLGSAQLPVSQARLVLPESAVPARRSASNVAVPEELISQVQTVLQGKSRRAVIRELLRVNLDVNMAVNNLLGREDDEGSESDDLPNANEMLRNLMDEAIEPGGVDAFGTGYHRPSTAWSSTVTKERVEKQQTWSTQVGTTVVLGDTAENLQVDHGTPTFTAIASLRSELICVDEKGQLYQWRWEEKSVFQDANDPTIHHPKSCKLELIDEQVTMISACSLRATVLTASGKLATFVDDTISMLVDKLEHAATSFPELANEKIKDLSVCLMYSCILMESGSVFWWGVMPLGYRHRAWDKNRVKSKKSKSVQSTSELQVGSTVLYRNGAVYQPGAIAVRVNTWGDVQCGELVDNMWDLVNVARFRLLDPQTGNPVASASEGGASRAEPSGPVRMSDLCSMKRKMESIADINGPTESWSPKDVIIVDEGKKAPIIGKIVKMTEDSAYVSLPSSEGEVDNINAAVGLDEPRLIKKNDLQIYRGHHGSQSSKIPDCIQRTPKKLRISAGCQKVLACAPNSRSIQMIVLGTSGKLSFVSYNLQSGKKDSQSRFMCGSKYITGTGEENIKLVTGGRDGFVVMLDGNKCFYPIEKDNSGNLRTPYPLNCSPVHSLHTYIRSTTTSFGGVTSSRSQNISRIPCAVVAFAVRRNSLIQNIIGLNVEKVKALLDKTPSDVLEKQLHECSDGNRNVFHVCASVCAPRPRKDFPRNLSSLRPDIDLPKVNDDYLDIPLPEYAHGSQSADYGLHRRNIAHAIRRSGLRDGVVSRLTESCRLLRSGPSAPEGDEPMDVSRTSTSVLEEKSATQAADDSAEMANRMERAMRILNFLCSNATAKKILLELMAAKNSAGMTPFMYAVLIRSYEAALIFLNTTATVICESYSGFADRELSAVDSKTIDSLVMEFLYPTGSHPDDSPLFVLCLNDVCTYTWTGACHIQQDVWECRTCGLTGTLCCCTECARTCHRGHDCKIKRSSPTAYCDCWEKSKCQSLVSGDENIRLQLFSKLVSMSTDLVIRPNSKGEFLLQYLVQTVGRQLGEQKFLKSTRNDGRGVSDLLSPPKFCQLALTLLLGSYDALKTALMTGYPNPRLATFSSAVQEDQFHLSYQSGTALLDRFIFVLLTKCNSEHVEAFVKTVQAAAGDLCDGRDVSIEAQEMTSRFVRAIVRVYVVLTAESSQTACRNRGSTSVSETLLRVRRVFRQLPSSSVVELCEAAEALIAPVRVGVARPTAGFVPMAPYVESSRGSDDLFRADPLVERRRGRRRESHAHGRQQSEIDSQAVAFEDEFDQLIIPPDHSERQRRVGVVVGGDSGVLPSSSAANIEPSSSFSITSNAPSVPPHDPEMSDMDIDEADSDGTDSDAGEGPLFSASAILDQGDQQQDSGSQEPFSENENDEDDDEENSDHSNEEEDEDDDVESDGVDMDDSGSVEGDDENLYPFFTLESGRGPGVYLRTGGSLQGRSSGIALPPGMQWATNQNFGRSSQRSRGDYFSSSGGSNRQSYIYMDSFGLIRRTNSNNDSTSPSFNSTFANLARSYGIIVREIAEIMSELRDSGHRDGTKVLEVAKTDRLENFVDESLKRSWSWLCEIMDSTEAQLRFGYALHQSSDSPPINQQRDRGTSARDYGEDAVRSGLAHHVHISHSKKISRDGSAVPRNDFLAYALSLMRAHNSEHGDALPVLDVSALKHIAYLFDALLFYIRITTDSANVMEYRRSLKHLDMAPAPTADEDELEELAVSLDLQIDAQTGGCSSATNLESMSRLRESGRNQPFFRRTRSITYLGSAQIDPFKRSLAEVLPLADRPHMLLPNTRREELFGVKLVDYSSEVPNGSPASFKSPPVRLSLSNRQEDSRSWMAGDDSDDEYGAEDAAQTEEQMETVEVVEVTPRKRIFGSLISQDLLLGRWRQTLDLFSRLFADDVANEPGSLIGEIAPFPVKESKFRRDMERLRGAQPRELVMDVQRPRGDLIPESFAALNSYFSKRVSHPQPCSKIKITFRDEPGEGNGVARSFFTVIAEALLTQEKLPQLDRVAPPVPHSRNDRARWAAAEASSRMRSIREHGVVLHASRPPAESDPNEPQELRQVSGFRSSSWPDVTAPPYRNNGRQAGWSAERTELAEAIIQAMMHLRPHFAMSNIQRITGMLMQLDLSALEVMLHNEDLLNTRIDDALHALSVQRPEELPSLALSASLDIPHTSIVKPPISASPKEEEKVEEKLNDDDEPLFYEPGRPGFYALRPGQCSPARLSAFRNVGRLVGLALLQGEIFPLCLTRAIVKFILGHQRVWSDFAFHDPIMFETLRKLVLDCESGLSDEGLADLCLFFVADLPKEEGGSNVELKPKGWDIPVTKENVYDFAKALSETRMFRAAERALEALKKGVYDVITSEATASLTPEDFRLLLNGVDRAIDIQQLASWTNWQDETNDKSQDKTRFKHWFWNTVDKFTNSEKQELLYFWTGSSAMPASEAGFAPLPSITIRPADDAHLPTANTCISRLYIPYYSSKNIMRTKVLMAIKTKNFGFV